MSAMFILHRNYGSDFLTKPVLTHRRHTAPLISNILSQQQDETRALQSNSSRESAGKNSNNNNNEYPFYQLEVHLNSGKNLLAMDAGGTSDPYLKLKVGSHHLYRSRTINKTLNPTWNEHFMTILDDINQELVIKAYDHDFALTDDFLGMASINLSDLKWNEALELTLDLTENGSEHEDSWGQIMIGIRLQPKTQEEKDCVSLSMPLLSFSWDLLRCPHLLCFPALLPRLLDLVMYTHVFRAGE
jgi:hypothetical protein